MKIFLDSSVLIEYVKGNQTSILETIVHPDSNLDPCINHIVFSEFLFHFLALMARKSPLTLKKSFRSNAILARHEPIEFIRCFTIVEMNNHILEYSYELMKKYNLLPNDVLILSSCKHHEISSLATYDSDFDDICEQEGIMLIRQPEDIKK